LDLTLIKSPTLKGLKTKIKTPPAKFDNLLCKAKPTAIPSAPKIARKEVALTPKIEPVSVNNNPYKMISSQ